MVEPSGVARVMGRLPEGDCEVSLTPPYEGLDAVLVLPSIGQVWPLPDESLVAAPDFEPESAIFTFQPGTSVEVVLRRMGYELSDRRRT